MRTPIPASALLCCALLLALPAAALDLESEDAKIVYSMGAAIGKSLEAYQLKDEELDIFIADVDNSFWPMIISNKIQPRA